MANKKINASGRISKYVSRPIAITVASLHDRRNKTRVVLPLLRIMSMTRH